MPTRAEEIRTRQASLRTDLDALETQLAGDAVDNVEELQTRSDALLEEWDELTEELTPLAARETRIAQVRAAMADEGNREPGFSAPDIGVRTAVKDPFKDLDLVRQGLVKPAEMRARAVAAIEQFSTRTDQWQMPDDYAEQATKLVEKSGGKFGAAVAEHMLRTGSPEYIASFEQYLRDPQGYAQRAAMSLTNVNGGYLVPFTLDPTIILTNAGSANPYRQIANIKTTATNDWNGVTSAGVNAEWTAEGTEAADASPTVGPLKITPQKADAYVFGSNEIFEDSDFAQQLPTLMSDAKDRLEETAFAVGTGTGQPKGVITAGTSQSLHSGSAAAGPNGADVYALQSALPARFRSPNSRNVWLANLNTINILRNTPKFTGSTQSIVDDSGSTPTMLGKPFLESTSIVGTQANGAKVLAYLDGTEYYIVDRIGVSMIFDPVVIGTNRRPTGQSAWYMFWRVGADAAVATAIRVGADLT